MGRDQSLPVSPELAPGIVARDRIDVTLAMGAAIFLITALAQLGFDPAESVWIPSVVALATAAVLGAAVIVVRIREPHPQRAQWWAVAGGQTILEH